MQSLFAPVFREAFLDVWVLEKEISTQYIFSAVQRWQLNHRLLTTTPHKESVLQQNSENCKTPVLMRVAFVFVQKLS